MDKIELIKAEIERQKKTQLKRNPIGVIIGTETVVDADDILSFINSLPEEKPSEDLEQEIEKYYYEHFAFLSNEHIPTLTIISNIAEYFYEQGKKVMKEQMMKDAVEKKVLPVEIIISGNHCLFPAAITIYGSELNSRGLEIGDKVKVITVKED